MNRILLTSARQLENLICKFPVTRMAVRSLSPSMDLRDCQTRVESTRVGYIRLGTCFNTQTGVWGWIDWQSELIAHLKSLFLSWRASLPKFRANAMRHSSCIRC